MITEVTITYKKTRHSLKRDVCEYSQINFKNERWSVSIDDYGSSRVHIRITKTIKRRRYKSLQFFYDCYCNVLSNDMCLYYVNDPITNKKIQSRTKWFIIEPIIKEIYIQLKD
ncbi:MAG: hypothetical protein ACK5L5_11675 [Bacteroidales bacterium]